MSQQRPHRLTPNQIAWNKEVARIQRAIKRAKLDVDIAQIVPPTPTVITQKRIAKLHSVTLPVIRKAATDLPSVTPEAIEKITPARTRVSHDVSISHKRIGTERERHPLTKEEIHNIRVKAAETRRKHEQEDPDFKARLDAIRIANLEKARAARSKPKEQPEVTQEQQVEITQEERENRASAERERRKKEEIENTKRPRDGTYRGDTQNEIYDRARDGDEKKTVYETDNVLEYMYDAIRTTPFGGPVNGKSQLEAFLDDNIARYGRDFVAKQVQAYNRASIDASWKIIMASDQSTVDYNLELLAAMIEGGLTYTEKQQIASYEEPNTVVSSLSERMRKQHSINEFDNDDEIKDLM